MADVVNPTATSSDYSVMIRYWDKVAAVLADLAGMQAGGTEYLPMFPQEDQPSYTNRLKNAVFTNVYKDVTENLASKPFSKKVRMMDGTSPDVEALAEDIDGRGNNLHVFLAETFWNGINNGIDWIFVDKVPTRPNVTLAEERALGARPYWVHIPARNLLAVYSAIIDGKEQIVHARISEPEIKHSGWGEVYTNKVRILDRPYDPSTNSYGPAVWEVWEEEKDATNKVSGQSTWKKVAYGNIAIKVIALVPFITGRRRGTSWVFDPPMRAALEAQIDHYQQENGLKDARIMTAYPMLTGNGVTQPTDANGFPVRVPVGPRGVLFAPSIDGKTGSWNWIEPQATSLSFLAAQLKAKEDQIRELGRQPLTAQSGNLTVIMAGVAASKGNTAVQAWTWALKDAAEQAMIYTAMYMGSSEQPEVWVHTDFPVEGTAEKAPEVILKLRDSKEISRDALFEEMKRWNIISPDYDPEADAEKIAEEGTGDPTEQDVIDALGSTDVADPMSGLTPDQRAAMRTSQRMRIVSNN